MSAVMPEALAKGRLADTPSELRDPVKATRPEIQPPRVEVPESVPTPPSAADRLERSRARLRGALLEIAYPPAKPSPFASIDSLKDRILLLARDLPGASIVIDSIESWWALHPLRAAGLVAKEASQEFLIPAARRNPFGLILGATVLGALFAVTRPWRWLLRPALFIGLVPQLTSHALRKLPLDAWVHMATRMMSQPKKRPAPRATVTPGTAAAAKP